MFDSKFCGTDPFGVVNLVQWKTRGWQALPSKYRSVESTELKASVPATRGTVDFELKS